MAEGERRDNKKTFPKKILVAYIVVLLVAASGFYIWYEYFRHWTIEDLEDAVIRIDGGTPNYQGFETDLAGRTVTVELTIRSVYSYETNLGRLNVISSERGTFVTLIQWGQMNESDGDRIRMDVTFEWSTVNGAEIVASPQVGTPGLSLLAGTQVDIQAVCWSQKGCIIDASEVEEVVVVKAAKLPEPIPLGMSRCSIRAGTETDNAEYFDAGGLYRLKPDLDTIPNMTEPNGRNGTIEFSDVNGDGYLDDGDAFAIRHLVRPEESSGTQTYMLRVERDLYPYESDADRNSLTFWAYIIMTHRGLLWTSNPFGLGTAFSTAAPDRITVIADYIPTPASWDETEIVLSGGSDYEVLHPDANALETAPGASYSCGIITIEDILVECVVTDIAGNGLLDETDRFDLIAREGTAFYEGIAMRMSVSTADSNVIEELLDFFPAPVSDCNVLSGNSSIVLTLRPIHNGTGADYQSVDVVWDSITVRLSDGYNMTEWSPTYDALSGGDPAEWISAESSLGILSLLCAVVDLQGNGLANCGDRIELTIAGVGVFNPATEYVLSIVYATTGADVFSTHFTG